MKTKTIFEEQVITEMQKIPVPMQKKLVRVVRVFREEMAGSSYDEKKATGRFLEVCGSWEDKRSVNEQIDDIYKSRKSRIDLEKLV